MYIFARQEYIPTYVGSLFESTYYQKAEPPIWMVPAFFGACHHSPPFWVDR